MSIKVPNRNKANWIINKDNEKIYTFYHIIGHWDDAILITLSLVEQ